MIAAKQAKHSLKIESTTGFDKPKRKRI